MTLTLATYVDEERTWRYSIVDEFTDDTKPVFAL